jgi:hypothetical protein
LNGLVSDANLRLFNNSGTLLRSSSAGGTSAEQIKMQSLPPGTYRLQITLPGGTTGYSVNLSNNFSTAATTEAYPADSGIINVKTVYGAVGDGVTDDTAAIQRAISENLGFNSKPKILYFPAGTYLVSDTLEWKDRDGAWDAYLKFQGENRDTTIIKLRDSASGFQSSNSPKSVIYTAGIGSDRGNRGHNNFFENLTIHTGSGNPGAIGLNYFANNRASIEDVTIRSGDGRGVVGLSMQRGWVGPALVENLRVVGFDVGIKTVGPEYSVTFKDITLENQRVSGIENTWNILSIDGLASSNTVPVVKNLGVHPADRRSLMVLLNANLFGGNSSNVALENDAGVMYLRQVTASGYQSVLENRSAVVPGLAIAELTTDPAYNLFSSSSQALNLPVEDAPTFHDNNFANWANVRSYGAIPNDSRDDSAAIQAALDSGRATIYFPTGTYDISQTLYVQGNVRKIAGMESTLRSMGPAFSSANAPTPMLRFEQGNADAVFLEQITINSTGAGAIAVEQATAQTLVIEDTNLGGAIASYRSTPGVGRLFLEDVLGSRWLFDHPQNIWARQLNAEGWDSYPGNERIPKIRNNGANLWILGLKTEVPSIVIETVGGGKTEVLGGLLYPVQPVPTDVPAFISIDSQISLTYAVSAYASDRNYTWQVKETRSGNTQYLLESAVAMRDIFGSIVPLYTSYQP